MDGELPYATSYKLARLADKLQDPVYRHSYVASHGRQFLARQMRAFRGERSQTEFGNEIGRAQTMVSRLEDPNYHGWTLQTLFDVAAKRDVAVIVRFVDFPTFLKFSDVQSDAAVKPEHYKQGAVNAMVAHEQEVAQTSAWRGFFTKPEQEACASAIQSFAEGSPRTISASLSRNAERPLEPRVA